MRVMPSCAMELQYIGDFHLVRPYGYESGLGWGVDSGMVTSERVSGSLRWSDQLRRRGDGVMLPNVRSVITTSDKADVFVDLTGRTVFVDTESGTVGAYCRTPRIV